MLNRLFAALLFFTSAILRDRAWIIHDRHTSLTIKRVAIFTMWPLGNWWWKKVCLFVTTQHDGGGIVPRCFWRQTRRSDDWPDMNRLFFGYVHFIWNSVALVGWMYDLLVYIYTLLILLHIYKFSSILCILLLNIWFVIFELMFLTRSLDLSTIIQPTQPVKTRPLT